MTHWSRALLLMTPLLTTPASAAGPRPSSALATLFADDWQYHLSRSPTYASILGDRRWNDRWDDLSLAGIEANHQHDVAFLEKLGKLSKGKLSDADRLDVELIGRDHRERIEAHALGLQYLPLTHMRGLPEGTGEFPGVQNAGELATQLRFTTLEDYRDWLARLDGLPTYVDQTIALLQEGVRRKMVWPKVVLQHIPPQIDGLLTPAPAETIFYAPFKRMPETLPEADRKTLAQTAERLIRDRVQPAYRRLKDFVVGTYLPAAPTEVGVGHWPDGEKIYAFCARRDDGHHRRSGPPARPVGGGAHPRRDGGGEGQGRLEGQPRRRLPAAPHRPEVLLPDRRGSPPPHPRPRQAHRSEAGAAVRHPSPAALRRRGNACGDGARCDHRLLLRGRGGWVARRHLLGQHLQA